MKKIWRKLLAVALVGALVSNVACKDYDDDINRIDSQLEELTGTVALKTDVQQLQQTVNALNSIDFSAFLRSADFEARLQQAGVAYKSDLKDWLTGPEVQKMIESYGYQTAEQVKALIDGLQNADDVAATFDAMIAAYDIWGRVQGDVTSAIEDALAKADFMTGESKLSESQVNQLLSTISAAFGAEGTDVKAAIDGWLGENFAKYMASYEPTEAFIAKLGIGEASIAAVLGELQNANSDLVKEVKKLITDATNGQVSEETLNTRFAEYDKKIEALSIRVAELEGRIQSLVWVPETDAEIEDHAISLADRVALELTKGKDTKTVVLSESTKTVTWKVTPASVCKKIAPENVSIETINVANTRADEAPVKIADVAIDTDKGTIAVTISTDKAFEAGDKTQPAIALHVVVPGHREEGENGTQYQGIDFLSDYTLVAGNTTKSFIDPDPEKGPMFTTHLTKEGDAPFKFGQTVETELDYTNTAKQTFLEGFTVVAEDSNANGLSKETATEEKKTYTDVKKLYAAFGDNGALTIVCKPELDENDKPVKATVSDEALAEFLELESDYFAITEADKSLQGAIVSSGVYTYTIEGAKGSEYEGYSCTLGTVQMKYTLQPYTIEMTIPAIQYSWTYADYNDKTYESKAVEVAGLNLKQYNEIKTNHPDGIPAKLFKGEDEVAEGTLKLSSSPSVESDVKQAMLTITDQNNAFAKGGEYTVKGEATLDAYRLKFEISVTVKAMPKLSAYVAPAKKYPFDGQYTYELISAEEGEDCVAQLWAVNEANVKDQITKKEFAEMLTSVTPESKANAGKANLNIAAGAVNVVFDTDAEKGKSYKPALVFKHASGLECKIEADVTLAKSEVTFVPNSLYLVNGRAKMRTNLSGSTFEIESKDMSGAYTTDPAEGYELTYSIDNEEGTQQAEDLAAMAEEGKNVPAIADGVLSWNDWTGLELTIKVEAKKKGVTLDSTTFIAYIDDPVKAFEIDAEADNTLYAGESKSVASIVNLPATDDRDCFTETGLDAELETALKGSVKYEKVGEWNPAISLENGSVKVAESSIEIAADMEVKVNVTYTYQFGERKQEVTLVVKKGTRPQPEAAE